MPLYQLLGGASRDGPARLRARQRPRPARAVRLDPRAPGAGLPRRSACRPASRASTAVYGVAAQPTSRAAVRLRARPARRRCRPRRTGTPAPTCATCPTVFEAVRNEFGPELPLLHDVHHRLTPIQAARLGKSLEPYDLFWLEDCTPAENQEALRLVRQHTTTPLAIGEVFNTVWDYQTLITRAADRLRARRPSPTPAGSPPLRKLLDFAAHVPDQVRHPRPDGHLARRHGRGAAPRTSRSTTSASRSTCSTATRTHEVFRPVFTFADGYLHPGDEPGLGVELDDDGGRGVPRTRRRTCRSTGSRTARCTTGDRRAPDVAPRHRVPRARDPSGAGGGRPGRRAGGGHRAGRGRGGDRAVRWVLGDHLRRASGDGRRGACRATSCSRSSAARAQVGTASVTMPPLPGIVPRTDPYLPSVQAVVQGRFVLGRGHR